MQPKPETQCTGGDTPPIQWQCCELTKLGAERLFAVCAAREAVFVVEQACAYQELDAFDLRAMHLIAWAGNAVAAYARILAPGTRFEAPSIGRVLTTRAFRRIGLGRALMSRALEQIDALYPGRAVQISAQTYLQNFYAGFGFVSQAKPYLEDGLPHIEMRRAATSES
jgi:ElaA protein